EVTTAGDEPDLWILGVAVDLVVGEGVFAVVGDVIDAERRLGVVFSSDGESVLGLEAAQVEEDRGPILGGVDVADDE
ncbi:MAG: hypothetical protein L0K67_09690, partial [Brevibacterium sp.]|nr:hypothetical protein [Brevibacterium sp.]